MTRSALVSFWMVAFFGAGFAFAEETSPILKAAAPAVVPPPAPTPSPARPPISPKTAAQLTAAVPKFEPAPSKPAELQPDLRETDKPRNTIIRLPSYLVQEDKMPVLKERELLTPKERVRLALKKFPGLHVGSFWIFSNDGIALAMLAEEERLEKMRDMHEMVRLMPVSQQKQIKPLVDETFMRYAPPPR